MPAVLLLLCALLCVGWVGGGGSRLSDSGAAEHQPGGSAAQGSPTPVPPPRAPSSPSDPAPLIPSHSPQHYADKRPRIKGRFVSPEEYAAWRAEQEAGGATDAEQEPSLGGAPEPPHCIAVAAC